MLSVTVSDYRHMENRPTLPTPAVALRGKGSVQLVISPGSVAHLTLLMDVPVYSALIINWALFVRVI